MGWTSFSALEFTHMDPLYSLAGSQQPLGHTAWLLLCLAVLCAVQACHGPKSWWRRCSTSPSSTRGSWTFCSAPAPCCCVFWAKVGTRLDGEAPPAPPTSPTHLQHLPFQSVVPFCAYVTPSQREGIINTCIHRVYMGPDQPAETLDKPISLNCSPALS